MSEADHFRDAWRFLTILRIPDSPQPFAADWLARSLKYFPAVGICIGVVSAAVWLLADPIWGDTTAALLAIGAGVLMSGALHEDGLADTADAFGGGWAVEKRLAIMKDSRIGTYGVLALGFGCLLRVVALAAVLLLAGFRRRWDRATSLIVCMGVGWWVSFLVLVVGLGLRMTPPRGDNWAGCLGMVGGMLFHFHRQRLPGLTLATLVSGCIGGAGFAVATTLKLVEIRSGLDTNWHSILEQTYGLINGLGIAVTMLLLARRAPRRSDTPPASPPTCRCQGGRWRKVF